MNFFGSTESEYEQVQWSTIALAVGTALLTIIAATYGLLKPSGVVFALIAGYLSVRLSRQPFYGPKLTGRICLLVLMFVFAGHSLMGFGIFSYDDLHTGPVSELINPFNLVDENGNFKGFGN